MATTSQSVKQEELEHSVTAGQIRWLLNHCKREKFYMVLAFASIAIASGTVDTICINKIGINLTIPFFVGKLVDSVQKFVTGTSQLYQLVGTLFVLLIAMAVFNGLRHFFIVLCAEKIVVRLKKELFQKVLEQDIEFFDEHMTGELMNRLSSDTVRITFRTF
jgi:ABC-type multidrug transport system fused ATPase/permease subunit